MVALGLPAGGTTWISALRDMSDGAFFAVALLGLLAVVAIVALRNRRAFVHDLRLKFRRPGSRTFLREWGWNLVPSGAITWTRPLAVSPLSGARDLSVNDFAWGMSDGVVCAAFAAWIPEGLPIAIELADLPRPLPPLEVRPLIYDELLTAPGSAHRFVSESVDFNAQWVVRARDPRYASAILTPRVMERLLTEDASDMRLIIDGGALISVTSGNVPNERIAAHLAVLRDLVSLIPRATYHDFATGEPGNSWRWAAGAPGS